MGLVALTGSLTACGSPVAVTPAAESEPATSACHALHSVLPDRLQGQEARTTTPESPTTAAWGDPPIVLRCGTAAPAGLAPDSQLFEVSGVAWFPEQLTAGMRFTTVDRAANVEVTVPDTYRPEADTLAELAPAIRTQIPQAGKPG